MTKQKENDKAKWRMAKENGSMKSEEVKQKVFVMQRY